VLYQLKTNHVWSRTSWNKIIYLTNSAIFLFAKKKKYRGTQDGAWMKGMDSQMTPNVYINEAFGLGY